jgi:hypothetical protein
MKPTILTAWVAGVVLTCLGGCPAASNLSAEALLPAGGADPGDVAGAAVGGDGATAGEAPATDASTGSDQTAPVSQPGASEPLPLLYDRLPPPIDLGGQGGDADSGTDAEPLPDPAAETPTTRETILAAVDFVMTQFVTAAQVFGTLGELGSPNLNFNPYQTYEWGTCPIVQVAIGEDAIGTLISLDFGDGCAAPSTAGQVVIGEGGGLNYVEGEPPAVIFAYLTIDGHEVVNLLSYPDDASAGNAIMSGTLSLQAQGLEFAGTCRFAVEGIGGTAGDLVLEFGRDYTQTYAQADFTFTDDSRQQAATFAGVSVAPALYGNFLPDSGTATFTVSAADGPHTVEVQFTGLTPVEHVVYVSVDGGEPFAYTLSLGS